MEQAFLRPVPLRPTGPVDPAEALAHVRASLPELDQAAAHALALVEIAGRTREAAGTETGLTWEDLGTALYRARKELRRSMFPLSASGWCERAERLLSDRIDGALVPPGPARLDVHLRNCERCVEHEKRLASARDRLVRAFIEAHPHAETAGPAERPRTAELRVIEPATVEQPEPEVWTGPARIVPGFAGALAEPIRDESPDPPFAGFAGPGGQAEYVPVERPATDAAAAEAPAAPDVAVADAAAVPDPAAADYPARPDAPVADPPVAEPIDAAAAAGFDPAALVWGGLTVLSVALAVFALVVTVAALIGAQHIF